MRLERAAHSVVRALNLAKTVNLSLVGVRLCLAAHVVVSWELMLRGETVRLRRIMYYELGPHGPAWWRPV